MAAEVKRGVFVPDDCVQCAKSLLPLDEFGTQLAALGTMPFEDLKLHFVFRIAGLCETCTAARFHAVTFAAERAA